MAVCKVYGIETVLKNIDKVKKTAYIVKDKAVKDWGWDFWGDTYTNITNDFPLAGHPYAAKNPKVSHIPEWLVSKRTGQMSDSLEYKFKGLLTKSRAAVGWSAGSERSLKAPGSVHSYLRCIFFGTEKMVSRPFLTWTFFDNLQRYKTDMFNTLKRIVWFGFAK